MFHCTLTFYMERFTVVFYLGLGSLVYLFMINQVPTLCLRIMYCVMTDEI